jgi:glucose/arabinose dehydrogenase
MLSRLLLIVPSLVLATTAATSTQDAPSYGPPISLAVARRVLAAAEREAATNQWRMALAVVEPSGMLVTLARMDDTQLGSVEVARQKARSAAMFRRPTKVFEDIVTGSLGGARILALEGAVPIEGGVPLTVGGRIVGAIGVSGGTSEQDGRVARAGAAALQEQPAPAPFWIQGRPPEMANSPLQPHTAPMTATAPDAIPVAKLSVPAGFRVELWAHGMPNARSLALGESGTVFVGSRFAGNVYAVVDRGTRREVKTIATGLHRPNGVAFKDGALYVAELSRISRFDKIEQQLDSPPAPAMVFDDLPREEAHGWKALSLGPDGKLYFGIGAPCNICDSAPPYATIARIDPRAPKLEIVASGVRNTLGIDWQPRTRDLYFTENGRDWLGEERPQDELNRAPQDNLHFGFPHCHQGDIADPQFAAGRHCNEFIPPELTLGPHVAALGMRFYRGTRFPREYRGNAFIALHGSWNRAEKQGFAVMRVDLSRTQAAYSPFLTGFREGDSFWGRPVDVLELRDGSLLVSDDWNGAVYRIWYAGR